MLIPGSKFAFFLAATIAFALMPGPAVLFVVARSMSLGRRAGFLTVVGVGLGNTVHAAAAALGLAALLASSPVAFSIVKYLGAAYLVVLGVRRLLDHGAPVASDVASAAPRPRARSAGPALGANGSPRDFLRQAFVVAVLNPKTALFFLAFLPQFAEPSRGAVPAQILLLGVVFVVVALVTDSGYVLLAGGFGAWARRSPSFARGERYLSGAIYVGLGALSALVR